MYVCIYIYIYIYIYIVQYVICLSIECAIAVLFGEPPPGNLLLV